MGKPSPKPPKLDQLLKRIQSAIASGNYIDVVHAQVRQVERNITRPEYTYVLTQSGWHEKRKDSYSDVFKAWNYAIRGKTLDGREIRVIVSFDDQGLLIITVIDLEVS